MIQPRSHGARAACPSRHLLATAVALACVTPLVHAQDNVAELDRVQVIGSHIRKAASEGQDATLTIQRAQIERSGLTSVGDVLQDLTSGAYALSANVDNGG